VNRARRPPLQHRLAPAFDRAVDSRSASLHPDTTRRYRGTTRNFPTYLGAIHPEVCSLGQLRRDHILGWMSCLRSQAPPLATGSFRSAWRTLQGIETVNMIRKGRVRWLAKEDAVGQGHFIGKLFGLSA
jgi:hypothetical protein